MDKDVDTILKQLDKALAESMWKGPPSDLSHLCDPEHIQAFKALANYEDTISKCISVKASEIIKSSSLSTFRICSIGCADGSFDVLCIKEISRRHPELDIHYVGINADDQVHELAEENMKSVAGLGSVNLVTEDYHEIKREDFSPFDLIIMVNPQFSCVYEEAEVEPLIKNVLGLLKPTGELVIISSSRQSFTELIARFWKHQRKHNLSTTEVLTQAMKNLGLKITLEQVPLSFNLHCYLPDRFQGDDGKLILDQLVLVRLSEYDPDISRICVDYLISIAQGTVIASLCDILAIKA